MTARYGSHSVSCCESYAAAGTSVHMIPIMDTAISLAVSICVILSIIILQGFLT